MTPPKIGDTAPPRTTTHALPTQDCRRRPHRDGSICADGDPAATGRSATRQVGPAAEIGPLRRQAALWRAGIKPGAAADLFLTPCATT